MNFHYLDEGRTKVQVDVEPPAGVAGEAADSVFGLTSKSVEGDLERFKQFIEERVSETGARRGEISRN